MAGDDDATARLKAHYEPRIERFSESYRVLDWEDPVSQRKRFQILVQNVPLAGKSLLDVGCGLGDLYAFLGERTPTVDYTGVDILEKMVQEARRRHPRGRFLCRDIIGEAAWRPKGFAVLFCSGIFNLKIGDNAALLRRALKRFFAVTRETVVFNLLDERSPDRDERYCYFAQRQVRDMLRPYDCEIQIIGDYLPNDFTAICRLV
jgi:SAM-dependent methyltransferase